MKHVLYIFLGICWLSCKKADRLDHISNSGTIPAQISDVKITATPGGAILTYSVPKDPELLYVKAVYEIQPGVSMQTKSSFYSDTLVLQGFGDTLIHKVELFSIGKNEKSSAPLVVEVTPLVAPVKLAFDSLELEAAFGGVKVRFKNRLEANLAVVLVSDTSNSGVWTPLQTFYTKAPEAVFSFRGLAPVERKFAVYLRDRWNNKSDTVIRTLTPLYEELIQKPYSALILPTDEYIPVEPQYPLDRMWDGLIDASIFASRHSTSTPQWFTVNLGVTAVISRIKMHQRNQPYSFTGGNVKSFEIYGSNNPDPDGSWASWQLLGAFQSFVPNGTPTAEDYQFVSVDGQDFDIPEVMPACRYIRFKTTGTYGGGPQVTISEITFWGQIQ
jgi:hypothetical protein